MRQLVAAREISRHGYPTVVFGFDIYEGNYGEIKKAESLAAACRDAAAILLPLPCSYDGVHLNCPLTSREILVSDILASAEADAMIFAGKADAWQDSRVVDYYKREEFSVLNAIPTAEGALALVMSELPITVHGMRVGVLGFGRIGKTVASLFLAAGAEVTVFARSFGALAWAKAYGARPMHLDRLPDAVSDLDSIINTVPAMVLHEGILAKTRKDVLIVDLASKPGGVDMASASRLGRHAVSALSLPGKCSPDTAGKIISETILNILSEKGGA